MNITDRQKKYINFLINSFDGKYPTQREVAKAFGISHIAVSQMYMKLATRGYIKQFRGRVVEIPEEIVKICQE